jgi:hypothetical protein
MKTIFKYLALIMVTSTGLSGQEQPQVGFVRIVNAVSPGTGNAKFVVSGRDLYPDGYKLGQTTGGYGVKAGNCAIEVAKEGLKKGTTNLKIDVGETITLIAFAEQLPVEKPDDPPKWMIKLLRLKQKEVEKGFAMTIVSVCKAEEIVLQLDHHSSGKQEKAIAKHLGVTSIDLGGMRSEVSINMGEKTLTTVSPDSRGNYVVIVYENAENQVEALYFFDPKFVVAG